MAVADRIIEHAGRLTAAERRVAEVIADAPDAVAFGTVAHVAKRASTSGPTVVRFAVKVGYSGFVELQADVQREMAELLGPARDRIRRPPPDDLLGRVAAVETHNVWHTLSSVPAPQFAAVVDRLAAPDRSVWVLAGDATSPVGTALAVPLAQLRHGVHHLGGSGVAAARMLAGLDTGDTLVAIDIRRYERWLVDLASWAGAAGAEVVAITDGPLSPLAAGAAETLFFAAEGVGPFDSMAAGLALVNALVAGVAVRVRTTAAPRLDVVETAWTGTAALVAEPDRSVLRPPGPAHRMTAAAAARRSVAGDALTGQPAHGDGLAGQPAHGDGLAGQPAHGDGLAGQPAHGDGAERNGVDRTTLAGLAVLDDFEAPDEVAQGLEG